MLIRAGWKLIGSTYTVSATAYEQRNERRTLNDELAAN